VVCRVVLWLHLRVLFARLLPTALQDSSVWAGIVKTPVSIPVLVVLVKAVNSTIENELLCVA
jgi:hypothetical protein